MFSNKYFIAAIISLWTCVVFAQVPMTGAGNAAPTATTCSATAGQGGIVNAALDGSQNKTAIGTLVCGLIAADVVGSVNDYTRLDGLWLGVINSNGNTLVNIANPGTYNFTQVTGGGCTFTSNQGVQGGGGCYYNPGFNPATATTPNLTVNSASIGHCVLNSRTGAQNSNYGGQDLANVIQFQPLWLGNVLAEVNAANFPTFAAQTNAQGAWSLTRTSSASLSFYSQGSLVSSQADTSGAVPNANIYFLGYNTNGSAGGQMTDTWGYFFIGGGLTATMIGNVTSLLSAYLTTVYTGGSNPC